MTAAVCRRVAQVKDDPGHFPQSMDLIDPCDPCFIVFFSRLPTIWCDLLLPGGFQRRQRGSNSGGDFFSWDAHSHEGMPRDFALIIACCWSMYIT